MIVAGERGISSETALRLGRYFGTSPEFWMNLQASHDIRLAKQEMQARIEKVQPRETAA